MLLRFGFSNWLSVWRYQELSLIATKLKEHQDSLMHPKGMQQSSLPCLALYGANAAGKSNVLSALRFVRRFVVNSHSDWKPDQEIQTAPFRLSPEAREQPSKFDVDFIIDDVRHHYGFEIKGKNVVSEWLYRFPKNRRQVLFARNEGEPIYLGAELEERAKARVIEGLVRHNSSYLSASAQNNLEYASKIVSWFENNLVFYSRSDAERLLGDFLSDKSNNDKVITFLRQVDPNITGIGVEAVEAPADAKGFREELVSLLKKHISSDLPIEFSDVLNIVRIKHRSEDSEVEFDLDRESEGTRKLLSMLVPALDALKHGRTVIVDEIESSLHPLLATEFIGMFARAESESRAQLIFATHDTNILNTKMLRRDQIWFAEKSRLGETSLYSLAEMSVRPSDNIYRGYLQGRFGAIPFLGGVRCLLEKGDTETGAA